MLLTAPACVLVRASQAALRTFVTHYFISEISSGIGWLGYVLYAFDKLLCIYEEGRVHRTWCYVATAVAVTATDSNRFVTSNIVNTLCI